MVQKRMLCFTLVLRQDILARVERVTLVTSSDALTQKVKSSHLYFTTESISSIAKSPLHISRLLKIPTCCRRRQCAAGAGPLHRLRRSCKGVLNWQRVACTPSSLLRPHSQGWDMQTATCSLPSLPSLPHSCIHQSTCASNIHKPSAVFHRTFLTASRSVFWPQIDVTQGNITHPRAITLIQVSSNLGLWSLPG